MKSSVISSRATRTSLTMNHTDWNVAIALNCWIYPQICLEARDIFKCWPNPTSGSNNLLFHFIVTEGIVEGLLLPMSLTTMIKLTCWSERCCLFNMTSKRIKKYQSWEGPWPGRRHILIYFADEKVEVEGREKRDVCEVIRKVVKERLKLESRSPGAGAMTPPACQLLFNMKYT